ncbi:hypothetical protein IEQ34_003837 [Dendrobium chrysotoxum]|uniref:Uncharacterized protein n=1 Tax=Dendrobium chrysotoxum TaxID=161865 RepID=A0AAV7HES5_DENCH|nr:hypothetical protein IEQ34_003837 [Dendrobium chrysotoxum]
MPEAMWLLGGEGKEEISDEQERGQEMRRRKIGQKERDGSNISDDINSILMRAQKLKPTRGCQPTVAESLGDLLYEQDPNEKSTNCSILWPCLDDKTEIKDDMTELKDLFFKI